MSTATLDAEALRLVLAATKLRRYTSGRTPQLCVLSAGPLFEVDCVSQPEGRRPAAIATAKRLGRSRLTAQPLRRGHIARLYERTRLEHGLAEVRRTWRTGLRALRAEPRYVLHGAERT